MLVWAPHFENHRFRAKGIRVRFKTTGGGREEVQREKDLLCALCIDREWLDRKSMDSFEPS